MEHPVLSFTNYALFRSLVLTERFEHDALAASLLTEEELQRWRQSLEEAESSDTFFAHLLCVLVAGRNPK